MSTFDSTKTRLADLLRAIDAGKIQLPDFQRGWVWDGEHIRSLLTSIARAFTRGRPETAGVKQGNLDSAFNKILILHQCSTRPVLLWVVEMHAENPYRLTVH